MKSCVCACMMEKENIQDYILQRDYNHSRVKLIEKHKQITYVTVMDLKSTRKWNDS